MGGRVEFPEKKNYGASGPRQVPITPEMMKNAQQKVCECGCMQFIQASEVFIISSLAPENPTGKNIAVPQPVMVCMECKKVLR